MGIQLSLRRDVSLFTTSETVIGNRWGWICPTVNWRWVVTPKHYKYDNETPRDCHGTTRTGSLKRCSLAHEALGISWLELFSLRIRLCSPNTFLFQVAEMEQDKQGLAVKGS